MRVELLKIDLKDQIYDNGDITPQHFDREDLEACSRECMLHLEILTKTFSKIWLAVSSSDRIYGPHLPEVYIKIIPHPHSNNTDITIVPLSLSTGSPASTLPVAAFLPVPESRPWAPFRTLADFEYTETAVKGLLSKDLVDKQLAGFNKKWCIGGSHLTLRTYKDMQDSLAKAREYGVQVSHSTTSPFDFDSS